MSQQTVDPIIERRNVGSIIDMQQEIENDLQALDQPTMTYEEEDLDFVNLDQLDNCIGTNKSNKYRKYSIDDVLNQTVKHQEALNCIDQCIQIVLKTWKIHELKSKHSEDLYALLQQKKYKLTGGIDIQRYFYDKPSLVCSKILRITKRISAMKLLLDHQNMVCLPNTPIEWSILLERLKQKGQSLVITQRRLTVPSDILLETEPTTELKEDTSSDIALSKALGSVQINDSVQGVTAKDALQDILCKHRKRFTQTMLYKQMRHDGKSHGRASSIMSSILKGVAKRSKSPGLGSDECVSARNSVEMLGISEHHVLSDQMEKEPLNKDGSDSDIQQHIKHQVQVSVSSSSTVFNSTQNYEYLHKKWKNPKCNGCGHAISIRFDGKCQVTKQVITYDCQFIQDLEDTLSSLIYFHDKHCENLRKYKESIRKYVLESQLPQNIRNRGRDNMKNYVKHLLNHKDLLINIDSGKLPRPAKLLKKKKGFFKKNDDITLRLDIDDMRDKEKLSLMDIAKQRDIAVRILTRGEIIKQTFKKNKIKMFHHFLEENEEENDDCSNQVKSGIFDDIPSTIQYADSDIFGELLFKFVVQQLLSKQTTALWRLLAYISMQIATVDAISLLNEHQSDLAKAKKMEHLELVCTSIIQASSYPIGTALHLSGFISDLADNDLSREHDLRAIATRYINIAENLVEYVESDHLLALLLECPTDINQMNVFDIAIQFGLDDFFDNNRVDRVITHMHQVFDFLNPNKTFSTKEMSTYKLLEYMMNSPSKFYYSPIGKWWTAAILYIGYVLVVTIVCFEQNYLYRAITGIEWIMWIANAGYITYEITEIMLEKIEYFSETSNLFDTFISINWLILGFLRFLAPLMFPSKWIYDSTELEERNKSANLLYMFLFGIEMILLYLRFATILARSRSLGPYVRMIISMVSDIFHFGLIVLLLSAGFTLALSYVIGPDKDPSIEACFNDEKEYSRQQLSTLQSLSLYVFQVLLGQQEWSQTTSNLCFSSNRSRIAQIYIIIYSVLGTVLLLNLLIAMMASTYENRRQTTSKDVNSSRTQETYVLAHRNALIAAPFNIVAYAISLVFELITVIVILCSGGRYFVDITSLVPVDVNYNKAMHQNLERMTRRRKSSFSKTRKNCRRCAKCCCSFIQNNYTKNEFKGRRFCRYCRSHIAQRGDIQNYFDLFIHYRLDEDDVQLMKRIMSGTGVCPKCYRPYKILGNGATDRLQRWEIQLEVISYYVFRIFVHIPMILILLLPALFGGLSSWITDITKDSHKVTSDDAQQNQSVSSDEHYRNLVQNVINNELQQDIDLLSTQIHALDDKFNVISKRQNVYNHRLDKIADLLTKMDKKLNHNHNDNDQDQHKTVHSIQKQEKQDQIREISLFLSPQLLNKQQQFAE